MEVSHPPVSNFKDKLTDYAKNGGPVCTLIWMVSWILFAVLIYYQFGIAKSYALSYGFFFLGVGIIVLFSYEIADEIKGE